MYGNLFMGLIRNKLTRYKDTTNSRATRGFFNNYGRDYI